MSFHAHIDFPHLEKQTCQISPLLENNITLSLGADVPVETELLITEYCPPEKLDQLTSLRVILFPCAGVPILMRPILLERQHIAAHNLHYNDISVAENAMALLLAAKKKIIPLDQHLRTGHWSAGHIDTSHAMLAGSRCLLLGYGAIAQRLAPMLDAFGVHITVMKRSHSAHLPYPCLTTSNWKSEISNHDILISTLPSTPETRQIIDHAALSELPPHAVFINVGRGNNVDEEALYKALSERRLGAAGLDVWWNYPETYPFSDDAQESPCFPSDFPYQDLDNVVMLPHRGADHRMEHLQIRLRSMIAERINQASRTEPLPDRINLHLGY